MAIKKYKPTTPGRRGMTVTDYSVLSKVEPERSLLEPMKKISRPQQHRPHHRPPSRRRQPHESTASSTSSATRWTCPPRSRPWSTIPNRSAHIALVQYEDGEKRYIIAPEGLKVGDTVMSGARRRHQAGQLPAVRQYPRRYHHPQHRAVPRQGRAAGARAPATWPS